MKEIWKDIPDYENYQVSNLGRIKSKQRIVKDKNGITRLKKEIFMKLKKDKNGYYNIGIYNNEIKYKNFRVNVLVAETFIPNPNNYPCVNHKDENKQNNYVGNLEWCSYKYNSNYGTVNKRLRKSLKKAFKNRDYNFENNPNSRLTNAQRIEIKEKIKNGIKIKEIEKEYNVGRYAVKNALKYKDNNKGN